MALDENGKKPATNFTVWAGVVAVIITMLGSAQAFLSSIDKTQMKVEENAKDVEQNEIKVNAHIISYLNSTRSLSSKIQGNTQKGAVITEQLRNQEKQLSAQSEQLGRIESLLRDQRN